MRLTEEQLLDELRAMRPLPEPAFAAELDRRAAAGLPRHPGETKSPVPLLERLASVPIRRVIPALGAVATLAIVTTIAVSQIDSTGNGGQPASTPLEQSVRDEAAPAAGAESAVAPAEPTTAVPVPPGGPDLAPNAAKRSIERTVSITLSTEAGELRDVADGVVEVTDRYNGFVVSSQVREAGETGSRASFDLRVPTERLQEALADLSSLAHVKSRDEGSLDITAPVVSARERIADSRAELEGLLEQLAAAEETAESDAIRAQIRGVRAELAAARSELESLSQRAELTAITLAVVAEGDGDGWSLGDAADDAVSVLRTAAGVALVSLAILLPLALLAAAAWIGVRRTLRRSRERALDRSAG